MLNSKGCSETVFFLESKITKFFTAWKPRNKVAMTIIFFFKGFEILYRFRKWIKKKSEKVFRFQANCI